MITLEDGHQGFQRADGKFEVVTGKRNLKSTTVQVQGARANKDEVKDVSSSTEKYLKALMKTHDCSRAEALKMIKCYKCQKRGHFAKDCTFEVNDNDDSTEAPSGEEKTKPTARNKSVKKSPQSYVANFAYEADTSEDDDYCEPRAYHAELRPRSCFDAPSHSPAMKNPVRSQRNKVKYKP